MPRHTLKLLSLSTLFVVAPATANADVAAASNGWHRATCPHERAAQERAGAIAARLAQARNATIRITLIDRIPKYDSLSELGGGASLMRP
jgi:hypothetical protein